MFLQIKFFINKLFSSKYKLKGECRQCGECCRTIIFAVDDKYIREESEFEDLKKTDKRYRHFFPTKKDEDGILLFTCRSLTNDNKCKDYFLRSFYCRKYPNPDKKFIMAKGRLLEGCGYKIDVDREFKDYLKH